MAQRTRTRRTQTPRSLIMNALVQQGYTRQEATHMLSIARRLRQRDGTIPPREASEAMRDLLRLSPAAARHVSDIAEEWNEVAREKNSIDDFTGVQARWIAGHIENPPKITRPRHTDARGVIQFMYNYYTDRTIEDGSRSVRESVPRRTR